MEIDFKLCFQPLIEVPLIGSIFDIFFQRKSLIVKTNNFAQKQKFVIGSYHARRALSHFDAFANLNIFSKTKQNML